MTRYTKKTIWGAWLIASIFYAYQFVLRVMPNIMIHDIMNQFQIDTALFGQFSGIYYIGYCLMHIPIGIFLDRFGPKKVMSLSIFLTTLGLLPIIFATHWIYPILGRFLIGIGSSGAILGAFKIIRMTFPESQFTRMLSFTVTIGLIGGLYGGVPVGYFSKILGYQKVVEFLIVIGIVFAILTYIFVPQTEEKHSSSILSDIKTVFCNKKAILICFFAGLMVGPMEGFADAWGSEFFKRVYLFNDESANSLTSMIYMGMLFAPVLSKIAEKTNAYIETIIYAGIIMFLGFVMTLTGSLNYYLIFVLFFIIGICCAYQILAIYKASTCVSQDLIGLTTAIANMIIMMFGYFFHSSIGSIIQISSHSGTINPYIYGISIIPITLLMGVIGFINIRSKELK